MNATEREAIIVKAKDFFLETIAQNHIAKTKKLTSLSAFNVNPFLLKYLSFFLTGNDEPRSLAKALIYPRVLSTSITTIFGQSLQDFCVGVLDGYGSAISGLDIEFIDHLDGRKKYCQMKSGPNTINSPDVDTIINKFDSIRRLARTNNLDIRQSDQIVAVLYGSFDELSSSYLKINERFPVFIGKDFWHRFTGEENFYIDLIGAISEVAAECDGSNLLEEIEKELAEDIENNLDFSK